MLFGAARAGKEEVYKRETFAFRRLWKVRKVDSSKTRYWLDVLLLKIPTRYWLDSTTVFVLVDDVCLLLGLPVWKAKLCKHSLTPRWGEAVELTGQREKEQTSNPPKIGGSHQIT